MAGGKNSQAFRLSLDTAAFSSAIAEEVGIVEEAVRPAAQAGAQVLYDAVKLNVNALGRKTGNLASAIYQAFSPENSGLGVAEYHVSWNSTKAPHGFLVEFGHIQKFKVVLSKKTGRWITLRNQPLAKPRQVGAQSFVRKAVSLFPKAEAAMEAEFLQRSGYAPS